MFGEGAEVDKTEPQLLEAYTNYMKLLGSIHLQVYTIFMRQASFTGFYPSIPYSCQMEMYQLSEENRTQKIG